jgi:hypothetical protein
MGPNKRAQERERAAARAAAEAKRAEAERKAIAEAERIVAIWDARQAGGRALGFYPDDRCRHRGRAAVAHVVLPGVSASRRGGSAHARPAPGASISSLIPSVSCRRCSPNAPFARLEMLTAERP